jgi:hypothetical protein
MIDLETLGTASNAPVLTLGACAFDINTGEIGAKFHGKISAADALRYGRMSGDTFVWWMKQGDAARERVVSGRASAFDVLTDFVRFVRENFNLNEVRPWGNGASFDISMIEAFIATVTHGRHPADQLTPPWKFWNIRDCRTIKDLGEAAGHHFEGQRKGTFHDALDDAMFQAEWTAFYWRKLTSKQATQAPPSDKTSSLDSLLGL